MGFEQLVGQDRAIRVLRTALKRGRVAHSYLFTGPESVGKSTAALLFAQALNCEADPDDAPCGRCRSCLLIELGNHPDVRVLKPDQAKRKAVIPIETIRQDFVYDVHLRPVMGRYKVYLLDHIERTAHLAVHTILKTLEEPPPYVVTIIVTESPTELPPTIPSRCQKVAFQLAGTRAIEAKLREEGLAAETAAAVARLSGGRVGWALRASRRPELLAARKALLELCARAAGAGLPAALRIAEEIRVQAARLARAEPQSAEETEDDETPEAPAASSRGERAVRAELPWCLDVMASWYRDLIASGAGTPPLNPDYEEAIRARANPALYDQAECAIERILETRHAIERNANLDLALESLAIALVGWCA